MIDAVMTAYLIVLPMLLGLLGLTALGRDRFSAGVLLAVFAGFAGFVAWEALGMNLSAIAPPPPAVFAGLWPAAAIGLWLRLARDRRQGHVRSTVESLAVLASGAILIAVLVSLPGILAPDDPAQG